MKPQEPGVDKLKELKEYLIKNGHEMNLKSGGRDLTDIEVLKVSRMNITQAQILRDSCKHLRKLGI